MPDDSKKFEIEFTTKVSGDGAEKTADGIKEVTEKTKEATAAIRDYATAETEAERAARSRAAEQEQQARIAETKARTAGTTGSGLASGEESVAAVRAEMEAIDQEKAKLEEINLAEEKRLSLMRQRETILATETEALAVEAAGDTAHATALQREILIMREAVRIQQAGLFTEEQALAIATERVVAVETIAATERAQAALNAERVAEENALLAIERRQTIEMEKQAAAQGALMRSLASTAGSKLGVGGIAGALTGGIGGIAAVIGIDLAIQALSATLAGAEKKAHETAKAQETAAKAEQERLKGFADATKQAMTDAETVANSLLKSLDEVIRKAVQGKQQIDALEGAKAENADVKLDQEEQNAIAAEPTQEGKARVRGEFEQKRMEARQKADTEQKNRDVAFANMTAEQVRRAREQAESDAAAATGAVAERQGDFQSKEAVATGAEKERRTLKAKHQEEADRATAEGRGAALPLILEQQAKEQKAADERAAAKRAEADEARKNLDRVQQHEKTLGAAAAKLREADEKAQNELATAKLKADTAQTKQGTEAASLVTKTSQEIQEGAKKDAAAARERAKKLKDAKDKAAKEVNDEEQRKLDAQIKELEKGADTGEVDDYRGRLKKSADLKKQKIELQKEQDKRENKAIDDTDYERLKKAVDQETTGKIESAAEKAKKKTDMDQAAAERAAEKEAKEERDAVEKEIERKFPLAKGAAKERAIDRELRRRTREKPAEQDHESRTPSDDFQKLKWGTGSDEMRGLRSGKGAPFSPTGTDFGETFGKKPGGVFDGAAEVHGEAAGKMESAANAIQQAGNKSVAAISGMAANTDQVISIVAQVLGKVASQDSVIANLQSQINNMT